QPLIPNGGSVCMVWSGASTPYPKWLRPRSQPPTYVQPGFPEHHLLPSRSVPQEWLFEGGSVRGIKCDATSGPEYYARMTSSPLLCPFTPTIDHPTSLLLCLAPRPCWVDHGTGLRSQVRIPP
ncbi:unnamed protein product, partial [Musa textilis]